jgi:hypothetical protein
VGAHANDLWQLHWAPAVCRTPLSLSPSLRSSLPSECHPEMSVLRVKEVRPHSAWEPGVLPGTALEGWTLTRWRWVVQT